MVSYKVYTYVTRVGGVGFGAEPFGYCAASDSIRSVNEPVLFHGAIDFATNIAIFRTFRSYVSSPRAGIGSNRQPNEICKVVGARQCHPCLLSRESSKLKLQKVCSEDPGARTHLKFCTSKGTRVLGSGQLGILESLTSQGAFIAQQVGCRRWSTRHTNPSFP